MQNISMRKISSDDKKQYCSAQCIELMNQLNKKSLLFHCTPDKVVTYYIENSKAGKLNAKSFNNFVLCVRNENKEIIQKELNFFEDLFEKETQIKINTRDLMKKINKLGTKYMIISGQLTKMSKRQGFLNCKETLNTLKQIRKIVEKQFKFILQNGKIIDGTEDIYENQQISPDDFEYISAQIKNNPINKLNKYFDQVQRNLNMISEFVRDQRIKDEIQKIKKENKEKQTIFLQDILQLTEQNRQMQQQMTKWNNLQREYQQQIQGLKQQAGYTEKWKVSFIRKVQQKNQLIQKHKLRQSQLISQNQNLRLQNQIKQQQTNLNSKINQQLIIQQKKRQQIITKQEQIIKDLQDRLKELTNKTQKLQKNNQDLIEQKRGQFKNPNRLSPSNRSRINIDNMKIYSKIRSPVTKPITAKEDQLPDQIYETSGISNKPHRIQPSTHVWGEQEIPEQNAVIILQTQKYISEQLCTDFTSKGIYISKFGAKKSIQFILTRQRFSYYDKKARHMKHLPLRNIKSFVFCKDNPTLLIICVKDTDEIYQKDKKSYITDPVILNIRDRQQFINFLTQKLNKVIRDNYIKLQSRFQKNITLKINDREIKLNEQIISLNNPFRHALSDQPVFYVRLRDERIGFQKDAIVVVQPMGLFCFKGNQKQQLQQRQQLLYLMPLQDFKIQPKNIADVQGGKIKIIYENIKFEKQFTLTFSSVKNIEKFIDQCKQQYENTKNNKQTICRDMQKMIKK